MKAGAVAEEVIIWNYIPVFFKDLQKSLKKTRRFAAPKIIKKNVEKSLKNEEILDFWVFRGF